MKKSNGRNKGLRELKRKRHRAALAKYKFAMNKKDREVKAKPVPVHSACGVSSQSSEMDKKAWGATNVENQKTT